VTVEKTTEDELQVKINALWEHDPVHPTEAGYETCN
jgi:hypothetical protein